MTAEQIVFLFLGIGLFAFNHPFEKMGWGLMLTTIVNLNIARFLNILVTTHLVNWSRSEETKLPLKMQFVMWLSGLRGAMAYALALKCATSDLEIGPLILILTLIYAFLTILGVGSILNPILAKLDVKKKAVDRSIDSSRQEEDEVVDLDASHQPNNCFNRVKKRIKAFDNNFLAKVFIDLQARDPTNQQAGIARSSSLEPWPPIAPHNSRATQHARVGDRLQQRPLNEQALDSNQLTSSMACTTEETHDKDSSASSQKYQN